MTITDFAHEAAKRFCAAIMSRESVEQYLDRIRAPAALRTPEHVGALVERLQRMMEAALVEHFTVAELAGLARFYGTPEGLSLARKGLAFTAATRPMLEAEVVAWARSLPPTASAGGSAPL
jgi:hypothetical protein